MLPTGIVDLSHPLETDMPVYPGDPPFAAHPCATLARDGYAVTALALGSHTGTHVDAPAHFVAGGATIDALPLTAFVGRAVVTDLTALPARAPIAWADLAAAAPRLRPGAALLLHTGWSARWRDATYVAHPFLTRDAAARVVAAGVRVVGIDALSVDETVPGGEGAGGFGAHEAILGAGGVIAENLANLGAIAEGEWVVSLLPLNLAGGDGSPVRAVAWKVGAESTNKTDV